MPALPVKLSKYFAHTAYNHLSPERHPTFVDNQTIRIAATFQYKIHYYGLSLLWSLSCGLEVVCIGRVVLPYVDLEVGRTQLV